MADIEARLVQLRDEHNLPIVPRVSSQGVIMSDGTTLETYIAAHGGGESFIFRNTTAGWESQPDVVAAENILYVYIDGDVEGLDYSKFVPSIVKLCQIQQQQIDELKKEVEELKNK